MQDKMKLSLEDLKGLDKQIYLNCTFNYTYPASIIPVQPKPAKSDKIRIDNDDEFNAKLYEFIQNKIDMKLPTDLIEEILNAESEFFNKYE